MVRHFLDLFAVGAPACRTILDEAARRKAARSGLPKAAADLDSPLAGHALAMVFERPSTRTRVSFDMAMRQLGGQALVLSAAELQLGRGETVEDTARVLARYVDAVMIRTSSHDKLIALAAASSAPVINGLTDFNHPCQAMADVMTFEERRGPVAGSTWAWLGDGNNVAHALIEAAGAFGFHMRLGCADGHHPDQNVIARARALGSRIDLLSDAAAVVEGADAVVTDAWVSMGQMDDAEKLAALAPFQVTPALMARAAPGAIFLHCLPAHRGEEVVAEVIDGPQSAVWDEAENRLHAQKAILLWCLEKQTSSLSLECDTGPDPVRASHSMRDASGRPA